MSIQESTNTIMENSQKLVEKIYESMGKIERCDALIEKVKGMKFAFVDDELTHVVDIYQELTDWQQENTKQIIIGNLVNNKNCAEIELAKITGQSVPLSLLDEEEDEDIVNDSDDATIVPESEKHEGKKNTEKTNSQFDQKINDEMIGKIQKLLDEGKSQAEAARSVGISPGRVSQLVNRGRLKKKVNP